MPSNEFRHANSLVIETAPRDSHQYTTVCCAQCTKNSLQLVVKAEAIKLAVEQKTNQELNKAAIARRLSTAIHVPQTTTIKSATSSCLMDQATDSLKTIMLIAVCVYLEKHQVMRNPPIQVQMSQFTNGAKASQVDTIIYIIYLNLLDT